MSSSLFLPPAIHTVAVELGFRDSRSRRWCSAGADFSKRRCPRKRSIRAETAAERFGSRKGESFGPKGESFGPNGECDCDIPGRSAPALSNVGNSTNIAWHECPVGKLERQNLLNQKGCVIWITGLSGSGKSTLACALSRELHVLGYLSYVLDGDNIRHGLNKDLCFKAEDRAENIRRIGEVAKLFADAGVICIASLISPYRRDRDACRAMLPESTFIEVYMDISLEVCESRDAKGLYKLAREGKIKGMVHVSNLILIRSTAGQISTLLMRFVKKQEGGNIPSGKNYMWVFLSYKWLSMLDRFLKPSIWIPLGIKITTIHAVELHKDGPFVRLH